jgi:hypothetical protein
MADTSLKTQGQKKAEMSTANFITVAVLVTFLVVVGAGILLKGRWSAFQLNNKVSAKKSTAIVTLQNDLTAYNSLESTYRDLVGKREDVLILDALPTTPDLTGLSAALDQQASQSGVALLSVANDTSTDTGTATTASGTVNVVLTVTGSYTSVMNYLKTLEQSARPMKVTNVALSGTATATNASISLTTYYSPAAKVEMTTESVK